MSDCIARRMVDSHHV